MEIKEVLNKKTWDDFVISLNEFTFLQGWNWGEIRQVHNDKIWRFGIYDGKKLIGVCQTLLISAKRGRFLFVPHGPLFLDNNSQNLEFIIKFLKDFAIKNNCSFLRISPLIEDTSTSRTQFKSLGFRFAPVIMHAEETWLVPVSDSEDTILSNMRKTTRNLIHRAERDGVVITKSQNVKDVDYLYDLEIITSNRNHFVPFSKKILQTEMKIMSTDNQCVLFLGSFEGKVIGAAIIVYMGKFAFYYQSGSIESKVPVNYLLQWEVIKEAKTRGCTLYNMWGIAPPNKPKHPWIGLTTFKTGFGGFNKNYLHAQDLPLSPKYYLSVLIEKIPKTLRSKFSR